MSESNAREIRVLASQPGIPFDHRSLWQPDPAEQVGIAGIGAEIVELRVKFDFIDVIASSKCLLQSRQRGILFQRLAGCLMLYKSGRTGEDVLFIVSLTAANY